MQLSNEGTCISNQPRRPPPKKRLFTPPETRAPSPLVPETPVEINFEEKYRKEKLKNQKLRTRISRLKTRNMKLKPTMKSDSVQRSVNSVSTLLIGETKEFFETQVKLHSKAQKGRRYSAKEKAFALSIYHSSPKCYRLLCKTFALPSISLLQKTMRKINILPGFHSSIFEGLRVKCHSMSNLDRLCSLVFDEMAIKQNLVYNARSDLVEGFDNVVGQSQSIATHVGVFMVQGLTRHWKQPVGYFLSASTISPVELLSKVLECVRKIQNTGLVFKLFI